MILVLCNGDLQAHEVQALLLQVIIHNLAQPGHRQTGSVPPELSLEDAAANAGITEASQPSAAQPLSLCKHYTIVKMDKFLL